MNTLHPVRCGLTLAITAAIINIVCALIIFLIPDQTTDFISAWMHGIDLTAIKTTEPITIGRYVYGLFGLTLFSFTTGWLFAFIYNRLKCEGKCH